MPTTRLTYKDHRKTPDDGLRYEILDGQLVVSPPACTHHQEVLAGLVSEFCARIGRRRRGQIFANLDCEITRHDIVCPDMLLVLAMNVDRITKTHVKGTPDLAVEILSPGTARRDRSVKLRRYEHAGTPELWLVDPVRDFVRRYVHDGTAFGRPSEHRTRIRLHVLPDVEIDLRPIW